MFKRSKPKAASGAWRPTKLLAWAIGLGLLFGLIEFGEVSENWMRVSRNRINQHAASGEIVLVAIDSKAVRDQGRWPWKRSRYAQLVTAIDRAHPRMQLADILFEDRTTAGEDAALEQALAGSRNVVLPVSWTSGAPGVARATPLPLPQFAAHSRQGWIGLQFNYMQQVWSIDYAMDVNGKPMPSYASLMSGRAAPTGGAFPVDYSINPLTVPMVSAADVINGKVDPKFLAGKTVVVGLNDSRLGDQYHLPGYGHFGGVYVHILGAETLKQGTPVTLGWWPAFLFACLASILACRIHGRRQGLTLAAAMAAVALIPIALDRALIFVDVSPALFTLLWVSVGLGWQRLKSRELVNAISGLPNLTALKRAREERDRPLIAARIANYAEIASMMPMDAERSLIDQVVKRLRVGAEKTTIYQGDEGIFAWTIPAGTAIGHHVEALHSLFRSAAKVGGKSYDISISFGVEIGSGRSMANRFASALVAADEAASEGLKWKYHDPERLRDASWRLSLLSQLDDAIDNGEVWVAFQPQLDLRTGKIRGAEALARWTHPEKGPISPIEFVSAAEQSDRIEKLTFFVLDKAVAAAAKINRDHGDFDMAVNLSARLLHEANLPARVKAVLQAHKLNPARLTLELTETAAMADGGRDIDALIRLRELGINISIDDYGTGLSTLDYLKKVPAAEIKIDQSFVKSMRDNRSDMVMVQSTIALAHSLGRTVVAEGVEEREVLDLLVSMGCEFAQGFVIGRPTSIDGLHRRLAQAGSRKVA